MFTVRCAECNDPLEANMRVVAPGTSFPTLVVDPCQTCIADRETLTLEINDKDEELKKTRASFTAEIKTKVKELEKIIDNILEEMSE